MQITKKIVLIQGNPDADSYCQALALAYRQGAEDAGHEVTVLTLHDLQFDPVLRHGYKQRTPWEPDLEMAWEKIRECQHMVWIYPTWWGTLPALLKGFIDRLFLPGKSFQYRQGSVLWDKLLRGKTARLITTMDSPAWYNWLMYRSAGHHAMKNATLEFCGVKPVKITTIANLRRLKKEQRERWLNKVAAFGHRGW